VSRTESRLRVADWLVPNATVFVASGCVMIIEIVAGRVVSQHLGQSLYTWTSIIGIILAGISVGNYLGGRLADRFDPRRTLAVMFVVGSATCLTIPAVNVVMGHWSLLWQLSWPTRIVIHVAVTFLTPSMILGTISPLVAKMALGRSRQVGRTIGDVYAWGAAGSIAGTFLAGFYLISWLGNTAVICVVAGILVLLSVFYGFRMKGVYLWLVIYLMVFAAAFGPGAALGSIGSAIRLREPADPEIRYLKESNYGRVMVREPEPGVRLMYLDKLLHTKVNLKDPLDLRYGYLDIYAAVTDTILPAGEPIRAMVMGGGGFAYPHYLELVRPGSHVEVCEIDPEVTKAAFATMGLPRDTALKIFDMDVRHRIQDLVTRKRAGEDVPGFHVIYGDSINDYSVPYHLTTREFNDALYELLDPDGAYILTLIDIAEEGNFLSSIVRTCRATFPRVQVVTSSNARDRRDTFVVICTRNPLDLQPAISSLGDEDRRFRGAVIPDATMQRIMDRSRALVLTDNFAPVENLLAGVVRKDTEFVLVNYMQAAVKHAKKGNLPRAMKFFNRALRINPGDPDIYLNMGVAHTKLGSLSDAYQAYEAALHSDPMHFGARREIAMLLIQINQVCKAIEHWEVLKKQYPENASVYYDLGHAYVRKDLMQEAMSNWREAVRLNPRHAAAHNSLGTGSSRSGNSEAAIRHYQLATKHDPGNASARFNLAQELIDAGREDESIPHLKLLEATPAASNLLQEIRKQQPNEP